MNRKGGCYTIITFFLDWRIWYEYRIVLIGAALLSWAVCVQAETVYNAATDFSLAGNPNGVWSYGLRDATTASSFAAFNTPETMGFPTDGLVKWDNDGASDPSICYNPTANSYNIAAWGDWNCDAGEIVFNPYGVGPTNRLEIRWMRFRGNDSGFGRLFAKPSRK